MLRMELPGNGKRGRPKRRFMDAVREDMAVVEVTEEDADDRIKRTENLQWQSLTGAAEKRRRILCNSSPDWT